MIKIQPMRMKNIQTFKALSLLHHGEQSLPPQSGAGLAGVGYEVVGWGPWHWAIPVTARTEPDAEAEDEDDEDTDGHQQPQHGPAWQLRLNLQMDCWLLPISTWLYFLCLNVNINIYIKVAISIFQCLTCVVSSSRSSFIRVKDTIFKDCY